MKVQSLLNGKLTRYYTISKSTFRFRLFEIKAGPLGLCFLVVFYLFAHGIEEVERNLL